jgi:hypothetical protein
MSTFRRTPLPTLTLLALLLPAVAAAQQQQHPPAELGTGGKAPAVTDGRGTSDDARPQAPVGARQPRADERPAIIPRDESDIRS